jgi:RNA polymerase sigma-70 factor (ECF subfamily)
MEDSTIVDLYWRRDEAAITETAKKYGGYCYAIAAHILSSPQDTEECVSDTYFRTWNAIPPRKPDSLRLFVGRITRNLALDRFKALCAEKRGGGQTELALSELRDCISSPDTPETVLEEKALAQAISTFLRLQPEEARRMFVLRYWYLESIEELAEELQVSPSKVKSSLSRTRKRLKTHLKKEGIVL